jgi:hypothetical protein
MLSTTGKPNLVISLFLAVLATVAARIGAGALLAGVLLAGAGLVLVNWIVYQVGQRFTEYRDALAITERVKLLQALSTLNPDQVRLLELNSPVVSVLGGEPEPCYYLRVGGSEVPFQFIEQFIERGGPEHLAPVGSWSEGSKQRAWAEALTNYLVVLGFAELARGNRSARWLDQARAMKWIGIQS